MLVLRAFRFTAETTAGAGTIAALAAAKPPSRAENAQTRRSAEVGERERRPSGEPGTRKLPREPPRLAQSHGARAPPKRRARHQDLTQDPTQDPTQGAATASTDLGRAH